MPKLEQIDIAGFKNLDDLNVTNLKKINYFIGASGAGKSSIWELLVLLFRNSYNEGVTRFGDLRLVIKDTTNVSVVINDGVTVKTQTYSCTPTSADALSVATTPEPLDAISIKIFSSEQKEYGYGQYDKERIAMYDPTVHSTPIEDAIHDVGSRFEQGFATFSVEHVTPSTRTTDPLMLRGTGRALQMSTASLSGGHSALVSLIACVSNNLGDIIVLEEPENGMHTELQKTIHSELKRITDGNDTVQLMIITHSPFLLGSIDENDSETNTYLMDNGKVLRPEGYSAKGARYLASKLVGISFEDIAPDKIVVCEGSLRALLRTVNERFYSCSIMFTSAKSPMGNEASGDSDLLSLAEITEIYDNRFNFFDKSNLVFIIDQPNDSQADIKKKLPITQAKLESKDTELIVLSKTAIEDYYGDIQGLSGADAIYIADTENTKTECAERIGLTITKSEFERVFSELAGLFSD